MAMNARIGSAVMALLLVGGLTAALTGCGASGAPQPAASTSTSAPSASGPTGSPAPSPTPAAVPVTLPTDCRAILSDAVLAQLEGIPLNDVSFGPSGVQDDGSLVCIWADPAADTTSLTTTISAMRRGTALDMLNDLAAAQGFTCYTPDDGTRCEKTWLNEQYPVTDGRTLYWRDGILIDTQYSNLAPEGYTASIVAHLFED